MPTDEWYYVSEGQQCGPVSINRLRRMLATGRLASTVLVWREGFAQWTPAAGVDRLAGTTETGAATTGVGSRRSHFADLILLAVRAAIPAAMLERTDRIFLSVGAVSYYLAMIATVLYAVLYLRLDGASPSTIIVCTIAGLFIHAGLQGLAYKFGYPPRSLLICAPTRLSDFAFLDCCALVLLGVTILSFSAFLWLALYRLSVGCIFAGGSCLVLGGYSTCLTLHPRLLFISKAPDADPAEEAFGIVAFFMKLAIRLTPVAFGLAVLLGAFGLFVASVYVSQGQDKIVLSLLWLFGSFATIVVGGLLPLVGHFVFSTWFLILDLARTQMLLGGQPDPFRSPDQP